jgi:hypothetical protein
MHQYNGMSFRSKTELKLAKAFEKEGVVFFPLPIANCKGTKKEPDFLVCKNGKWAILEVVSDQFHPSATKDADRTAWFQKHHVSIMPISWERAANDPLETVRDFLNWMDGLK